MPDSGDEDFVYAINAVAYKGCRVEIAGFRSNTAPRLIDVGDFFIDLGEMSDLIRKDITQAGDDIPPFVPAGDPPSARAGATARDTSAKQENGEEHISEYAETEPDDLAGYASFGDER